VLCASARPEGERFHPLRFPHQAEGVQEVVSLGMRSSPRPGIARSGVRPGTANAPLLHPSALRLPGQ
jgi:hypothetical protein